MKKQTLVIAVLSVALIISVTVNIVLWCLRPADVTEAPQHSDETPPLITADPERDMITIITPYGEMQYPAEYEAVLVHEGNQNDNVYTHTFWMLRGESRVELFSFRIGDEEYETLIGWLNLSGTQEPITVTSTSDLFDETWSEDDKDRFASMQIAVNDVIASIQTWEGFSE